jgi:hypothetical protein
MYQLGGCPEKTECGGGDSLRHSLMRANGGEWRFTCSKSFSRLLANKRGDSLTEGKYAVPPPLHGGETSVNGDREYIED